MSFSSRSRSCSSSRAKIEAGKKQMLLVLPIDLINVVKITAIEDGLRLSGVSRRASVLAGEAEDKEADQVR
jgi:hypothetical protein